MIHWFDRHRRQRDRLSAYMDGELDAASVARLEEHLAGCEACRAELEGLQAAADALSSLPEVRAPRSFALTQEQVARPEPRVPAAALAIGMRLATAAAAFALAAVLIADVADIGRTSDRPVEQGETQSVDQFDSDAPQPTFGEDAEEPPAGGAGTGGAAPDEDTTSGGDAEGGEVGETDGATGGAAGGGDTASRGGDEAVPDGGDQGEADANAGAKSEDDGGIGTLTVVEIALAVILGALIVSTAALAYAGRRISR